MNYKDIIIVGGGASGMMCAIIAKEKNPDKKVAVLEKQSRIGRKLLSTGNGRCNLYNINCNNPQSYHGSFSQKMNTVFKSCSVAKVDERFSKLGLVTHTDNEGRVYPFSNHAGTVLDVLLYRINELGIEVISSSKVTSVAKESNSFTVATENESYKCEKLVISTGSAAAPKLGADNSGISLLSKLGHKTKPFSPALCPIEAVDNTLLKSIKGVRQKGCASLFDGDEFIKTESGEIQFTENSLSGICVFNLSALIKTLNNPVISLNLNPFTDDYGQLLHTLKLSASAFKGRRISNYLDGIFVNKLGIAIMKSAGIKDFKKSVSSLTKNEIESICDVIYDWKFKVKKPDDFNKAQVCSGGVIGDEINAKAMRSTIVDNLYICGEAIDVDGDCGGFNLYFAFASGIIAGENL